MVRVIKKGRLVVFVSYGPRSQQNIRKLSLIVEKLKECFEISLVHVPDDAADDLPYIRIEPLDGTEILFKEVNSIQEFESKV
ncbi:MAG: hypothetical protein QXY48_00315 [Sulfolobales archaeon]